MKRTTILLPDDLARLVEEEAKRRSSSVSEVIRTSVYTALVGRKPRRLAFAGICEDPGMTSGAGLEDELDQEWSDDLDRRSR